MNNLPADDSCGMLSHVFHCLFYTEIETTTAQRWVSLFTHAYAGIAVKLSQFFLLIIFIGFVVFKLICNWSFRTFQKKISTPSIHRAL